MTEWDKYIEGFHKCNLKIGDKVIVIRKSYTHENGWGNSWIPKMDEFVGNQYTIVNYVYGGFILSNEKYYEFPYFVLKKAINLKIKKLLE